MKVREIKGYEGLYTVSDRGVIYSLSRKVQFMDRSRITKKKELKGATDKYGYRVITLYKMGSPKTLKIHRLVMESFRGPSHLEVNHKDSDKQNNSLNNLEYVTSSQNVRHSYLAGDRKIIKGSDHWNYRVTEKERVQIKVLASEGVPKDLIAKVFKIRTPTVYKIIKL